MLWKNLLATVDSALFWITPATSAIFSNRVARPSAPGSEICELDPGLGKSATYVKPITNRSEKMKINIPIRALALTITFFSLSFAAAGMAQVAEAGTETKTVTKGFIMMKGRVMMMKDGESSFVEGPVITENGTRIMADGTVVRKDGTKMTLLDGDVVNMLGEKVVPGTTETTSKMAPADAVPAKTGTAGPTPQDSTSKQMNGLAMIGGEMQVFKDGRHWLMSEELTLDDGTKIMTDGTIVMQAAEVAAAAAADDANATDEKKILEPMMLKSGAMMTFAGEIINLQGVMKKDGQMMVLKDGEMQEMEDNIVIDYGIKVMTDGTMEDRNGKRVKLDNGDFFTRTGALFKDAAAQ